MVARLNGPWSVSIAGEQWAQLYAHLFPGDDDEHAAVLRCGIATTPRGTRLLVHDVVIAEDGIDYIPGDRGYRKLVPEFVLEVAESCADDGLVYIAVHCHGGTTQVEFSGTDLVSHKRGYPALLDITGARAVGALVFAEAAVAGDIWLASGRRVVIDELRVVSRPERRLHPAPRTSPRAGVGYDRQARIFGDRGQQLIARQRIGIIGLGGAGSLINEYLARLGVGELILIDPDRVETSNLSRIVGATSSDARPWLTDQRRPLWVQRIGQRLATPKVKIAARVARQASAHVKITPIQGNVTEPDTAELLTSCDHIFLAADSDAARRLVDVLTHQYLIPSTQVGAKVSVIEATGAIAEVFSVSRMNMPGSGCLRCNQLIDPARLQEEVKSAGERRRQRYVDGDDIPAPSVITLNAVAAAHAVNDWLISLTGLTDPSVDPDRWISVHPIHDEVVEYIPRRDPHCPNCGPTRYARGNAKRLPVPIR